MNGVKIFSLILITIGLALIGYSGWKILYTTEQTEQSLKEAKAVINQKGTLQKKEVKAFHPKKGEAVGILAIPKLKAELPIVEGTNADDLEKGVGHYKDSYYPNQNGQIVLSGHRDTVFRRTEELEIGDELRIKLPYGSFQYQIRETKIVDKDDRSVITLQNKKEELILTTCYPFSYVGNAPKRYIIYGERI